MNNSQANEAKQSMEKYFFRASTEDFKKIPGCPIAYWISKKEKELFDGKYVRDHLNIRSGLLTGKDELFLRLWFEVSFSDIPFHLSNAMEMRMLNPKWLPVTGGGDFRKWYGNLYSVVNSRDDFFEIKNLKGNNFRLRDEQLYFKKSINWPMISSAYYGAKLSPQNIVLGNGVRTGFIKETKKTTVEFMVSYLSSKVANNFLRIINPTLNFNNENVEVIPLAFELNDLIENNGKTNIVISKKDWDSYETSWDFMIFPLLHTDLHLHTLKASYQKLRISWQKMRSEMHRLEEENNRIFIEAYGLQDELTPDVPLKEITLTCNPHYRYGGNKTEEELEALQLADTMREFISYAVGCMFGRYSLDKSGLVLANQGETLADYLKQVPNPRFTPDKDNVIPLLDGDWFADDITERFRQFLRVTFGEEHYVENLDFIEKAIGKDIRKFFLRDFYNDHVKRYKKRPIYWLFSSPKGTFNALIYLHRYKPDTISIVLRYLREFREKLESRLNHLQQVSISTSASQAEKTRSLKEIDVLKKQLLELDDYERNTLYPLATQQIAIDLDDGVKVNYLKFGSAVKKIVGLESKDED